MSTTTATTPRVVGFLRGLIEAVIMGGLAAAGAVIINLSTDASMPVWVLAAIPLATLGIRSAEGWVDQHVDPTVQRGRLGGAAYEGEIHQGEVAYPSEDA